MSSSLSPELLRGPIYGIITWSLIHWRHLVNSIVPDPYLDEVFHIPQAQAYWAGKWSQWDPKITTPPGLYAFTNAVHRIQGWYNPDFQQGIGDLRIVNLVLLYSLTVLLFIWTATTKSHTSSLVLKKELVTIQFPVLFFFSAFYYTDVLSTVAVVLTYVLWTASNQAEGSIKLSLQALQMCCGLLSLTVRQTNIFWVGVFLGGLQVIEVVKKHVGATRVHDPPIAEAFFEGQLYCMIFSWSVYLHPCRLSTGIYISATGCDPSAAARPCVNMAAAEYAGQLCHLRYLEPRCCPGRQVKSRRNGSHTSDALPLSAHHVLLLAYDTAIHHPSKSAERASAAARHGRSIDARCICSRLLQHHRSSIHARGQSTLHLLHLPIPPRPPSYQVSGHSDIPGMWMVDTAGNGWDSACAAHQSGTWSRLERYSESQLCPSVVTQHCFEPGLCSSRGTKILHHTMADLEDARAGPYINTRRG